MRTYDILKRVCERHNLQIIDIGEYESQPNFKKDFKKLTKGRNVAIAFVSNKFNKVMGKK